MFRHYVPLPTIAFGGVEVFFLFWELLRLSRRASGNYGIEIAAFIIG